MRVMMSPLRERIERREAKVGVVGLGHIGLPLALAFAEAGFPVTGIDVDGTKVETLRTFQATTDFGRAAELDCVVICVPTPLNRARAPDMSCVIACAEALVPHVRRGQLFVLESTTWPGTTDEVLRPILERSGLKAGVDFHLAYSPEREDPGNAKFETRTIPKLVAGHTPECLEVAQAFYAGAIARTVPVSSTRVAEMSKLLENIFRCVNIALVNELKMLCDRMDIDVWEVIEAATTKPFGFMPFFPGPGLGGHCIPIDPFHLTWKAREYDFQTAFIELAGEVNVQMPLYVVQRTMSALNARRKPVNGARLLVLGVAYKKDVDDLRESPALRVITLLKARGAQVDYHDPCVPVIQAAHGFEWEMHSLPFSPEQLGTYDAVLILTDHSGIDYARVVEHAHLVVDTRNATRSAREGREKIVKA